MFSVSYHLGFQQVRCDRSYVTLASSCF